MPDLFRYSNSFEPILLEGLTATLFGAEIASEGLNVVCKAVMALPEKQKNFSESLTAATWGTADNEDTDLEVGTMELAQYRFRVLDDIRVRVKNPAAVQHWRTAKAIFDLPQFPSCVENDWLKIFLWKASEFFVFEDTTPRFNFYSAVAATQERVMFSGWKFKLAKIDYKGKIEIWINGWPPTK